MTVVELAPAHGTEVSVKRSSKLQLILINLQLIAGLLLHRRRKALSVVCADN